VYNCQLCEKAFFPKSAQNRRSHLQRNVRQTKIKHVLETSILSRFFIFICFLKLNKVSGRKCDVIAASHANFNAHSMWLGGGGREGEPVIGWPRIKRSLQSHGGGGGQYRMYKTIIFINLISRSKKMKPKMLSCV
jgi:hypothetical protein